MADSVDKLTRDLAKTWKEIEKEQKKKTPDLKKLQDLEDTYEDIKKKLDKLK